MLYNKTMIRVRIAPSPTGKMHLGTARTALFNFLFARKNKGRFVLRIEDTDRTRSTKESEEDIIKQLKWLGLLWDEGPYWQMERLHLYKECAEKLLKEKLAYKDEGALKLDVKKVIKKLGLGQILEVEDLIHGKVKFDLGLEKDFIIVKSDGIPIFHFAVVVDDEAMKISHIIRGEEHLSNTPKQIILQKALGFSTPKYAHLPLILNPDRTKMSKRYGDVDLASYRNKGYLPESLLNYLAFLGWTPGPEEIYTLEQLIKLFKIDHLSKSPAIFYQEKLDWVNGRWIRRLDIKELHKRITEFGYKNISKKMVSLIQARMKRLDEVPFWTDFFFKEMPSEKQLLVGELKSEEVKRVLEITISIFGKLDWKSDIIKEKTRDIAEKEGMSFKNFVYPLRIAITGQRISPPLFESIEILGKEEVLKRLEIALKKL